MWDSDSQGIGSSPIFPVLGGLLMENDVFIMKDSTGKVNIGTTKNVCVVCGAEIPEGREICLNCEAEYLI